MADNPVMKDNFIFRLGELDIVFAMLKVLGKYMIDSGLDDIFFETGIFGPTNFDQIIQGKHKKIFLEVYFTLYLVLLTMLYENVLTLITRNGQNFNQIF